MEHTEEQQGAWSIVREGGKYLIKNRVFPYEIKDIVYNYAILTPLVVIPISKSSTLVLSMSGKRDDYELSVQDMRVVDGEIVGSINFLIRGHQDKLDRFRSEMRAACDTNKCVGISFFLRKLYYTGFRTIYADKILKPKQDSTLRAAITLIGSTMNEGSVTDVDTMGDIINQYSQYPIDGGGKKDA
jgi:hypothetical protein